jgi:hypothetical protein
MRLRIQTLAIVAGLLLLALPGHAAGLAGSWTAEFETPVGHAKYVFELALAGVTITGKATFERLGLGQKGQADLLEGKLTGDKVFFVEMLDMMGTPVRIEYKGTLKGDEIAFTRKVGDLGMQQFVAHRAKAQ